MYVKKNTYALTNLQDLGLDTGIEGRGSTSLIWNETIWEDGVQTELFEK